MEMVAQVLVLLHLIAFGALFGGLVVQVRASAPEVNAAMLHGAWLCLVTGAALVALQLAGDERLAYAPLGVKGVLTLLLVLLVSVNRRFASIPKGLWGLLSAMTVLALGVSVLWR